MKTFDVLHGLYTRAVSARATATSAAACTRTATVHFCASPLPAQ